MTVLCGEGSPAGEPWGRGASGAGDMPSLMLRAGGHQHALADARVEGLLGRLATLESTRVIEGKDVDLEAFGLSEPTLEVKVGLQNGESQALLVGQETPAGYSQYVQRKGEEVVYLVGSSTIGDLQRLTSEPSEKPTPVATETAVPTVVTATPTATGTPTARPEG